MVSTLFDFAMIAFFEIRICKFDNVEMAKMP